MLFADGALLLKTRRRKQCYAAMPEWGGVLMPDSFCNGGDSNGERGSCHPSPSPRPVEHQETLLLFNLSFGAGSRAGCCCCVSPRVDEVLVRGR